MVSRTKLGKTLQREHNPIATRLKGWGDVYVKATSTGVSYVKGTVGLLLVLTLRGKFHRPWVTLDQE